MNKLFDDLGFSPADILLPKDGTDMSKWAVVACDQFTSQPEYWEAVEETVGEAPSTLRLILPEAHLNAPDVEDRIAAINANMTKYLEGGVFRTYEDALIYVERTQSDGKIRHGLVGKVDLDCYDFTPGSGSLIRATEGTVLSRIPPRVRVRKDAPVELPHIMVLIDDAERTVIEPLTAAAASMELVYDFKLMQGGGHIKGYLLSEEQKTAVAAALRALKAPEVQEAKYGLKDAAPLLYAMGDGNHSLATAKQCFEDLKAREGEAAYESPARYALVELVNNHDDALQFEPIHRVVFGVDPEEVMTAFFAAHPGAHDGVGEGHVVEYLFGGGHGFVTVPDPKLQLPVGTLQAFLDDYLKAHEGAEVDYIHDDDVVERLSMQRNAIGFKLPAMGKDQLFKTVIADGVLPRKTFSMGHARDKRYYLEARKIR